MHEQEERIRRARTRLIFNQPFFGCLALRLQLREASGLGTMATDGRAIAYDPDAVEQWTDDELTGIVAHEVMHCALQHHERREGRDPEQWNIATDYAINIVVRDAKLALPADALYDEKYRGWSAERIYASLPANDAHAPQWGRVEDGPEQDDDQDGPPPTDWQQAAQEAAQRVAMDKTAGDLPGSLKELIAISVDPVIDWQVRLRDYMDKLARNDYTWTRPNRRYLSRGFSLPSLYSDDLGDIVIALDSSGSMTNRELEQAGAEIADLIAKFDCVVHFMCCDRQIQSHKEFRRGDVVRLERAGGGGTDLRPPFRWVEDQGMTPTVLLYFTDLCGMFPEQAPEYPVLWASTDANYQIEPPFGELIPVWSGRR